MARRRFKIRMRKGINISRVVAKTAGTVIALYVGGTILNEIAGVLNGTYSPFYKGLSLIGADIATRNYTDATSTCGDCAVNCQTTTNCFTGISSSGLLAVVGIVGIASIIMEFVRFKL